MESKQTLSEQIYKKLKSDIITQKIPCGEKLTLSTLKGKFNVSHTPIREALTRLSEDGLVTYYSNCGVNVITFSKQEIQELYQFIGELDALAIQFCKLSYSQELLLYELKNSMENYASALNKQNITLQKQYSDQFHFIFYKYAKNHYLNDAAQKLRAKIELLSNLYYLNEAVDIIQNNHLAIYNAIQDKNFDEASTLMKKHLQYDMLIALKTIEKL